MFGGRVPISLGSLLGPSIRLEMGGREILEPLAGSMANDTSRWESWAGENLEKRKCCGGEK